jgi:hypothetical protein
MINLMPSISYSFEEYLELVKGCVERSTTTGVELNEQKIEATKINLHRMTRITKQLILTDEIIELVQNLKADWKWVVITEAWCGDGAQIIPVIAKISTLSNNIKLEIVLRDENPELIKKYHTNNSLAIPKLICFDGNLKSEIGVWGPRPSKISEKVKEFKLNNPSLSHEDFVKEVQSFYNKDRGISIVEDMMNCINVWKNN